MKKTLLFPLFALSMLALPSCACGNQIPNRETVDAVKALLRKQDPSPIYHEMFTSTFTQTYDVFSSTHDDAEESETRFYSYRGGGMFGCLYEVSEDAYEEVQALESHDFFDYLSRGKGSYGMIQTATLVSYLYNYGEEQGKTQSLQSLDFVQRLESLFGDTSVQIYNTLAYKEDLSGVYDHRQSFNGIIDKGTLFSTITPRALSDIFARTNLYDGQRACEAIDRLYYDLVGDLCKWSDQELGDFVTKNAIVVEEQAENTLVHFKVGEERIRKILDEYEIIPGVLEGTLTYEKASGNFSAYDYKIVYVTNESDGAKENLHDTSMEFKANGYSWNKKYEEDLYIEPNPTVYDNAEAFLDDVLEEVVPPKL